MRRAQVAPATIASIVIFGLLAASALAYQTYSHGYSIGYGYGTFDNNISGIYAVRTDIRPTGVKGSGTGCQIPGGAGAAPIYQPQWISLVSSTQDWMEMGTGHQCDTLHFWYWGYGWQGQWTFLGVIPNIPLNQTAYMDLHRYANVWEWDINAHHPCTTWTPLGNCANTFYWNAIGRWFQVGIESYDDHAFIPVHIYSQLQLTYSDGPWTPNPSLTRYPLTPGLCGVVLSSTAWEAWQDSTC